MLLHEILGDPDYPPEIAADIADENNRPAMATLLRTAKPSQQWRNGWALHVRDSIPTFGSEPVHVEHNQFCDWPLKDSYLRFVELDASLGVRGRVHLKTRDWLRSKWNAEFEDSLAK